MTKRFLALSDDGASSAIEIPGGFPFGDSTQTTAYVSASQSGNPGLIHITVKGELDEVPIYR